MWGEKYEERNATSCDCSGSDAPMWEVEVRDVDVVPGKEGSVEGSVCGVHTSTPGQSSWGKRI